MLTETLTLVTPLFLIALSTTFCTQRLLVGLRDIVARVLHASASPSTTW